MGRDRPSVRDLARRVGPLVLGFAALLLATAFGWNAELVDAVVTPPALIRAALVAVSLIVGFLVLARAIERLSSSGGLDGSARDVALMLRAIRLVFLAVAAFSAALGWLIGHPLPLVLALVIAGVDVIETSFLLLVVAVRGGEARTGAGEGDG